MEIEKCLNRISQAAEFSWIRRVTSDGIQIVFMDTIKIL